jgi:hypothetical protein
VRELERDLRIRQGQPQHRLGDVAELGPRALEELSPRRRIEKQIPHFDDGSDVPRRRLRVAHRAAAVVDLIRRVRPRHPRDHPRHRDRADRRQRLAAKPHRRDPKQVVILADLAGRVLGERQPQILRRDPAPIIHHPDQLPAAVLDLHDDPRSPRVQRVLH